MEDKNIPGKENSMYNIYVAGGNVAYLGICRLASATGAQKEGL